MTSPRRDEDYIEFLQDQVRRLNAVLEEYQKKYLPVRQPDVKSDEPLPPWITSSSILSPLLLEYDDNIKTSQKQTSYLKEELASLKQKTDHVIQENTRLHEELKRSIESQMEIVRRGEGTGVEKEVIENMRHQLHLISQERDSYVELWQNACGELEKLQEIERVKEEDLKTRTRDVAILQNDLQKARKVAEELQAGNRRLRVEQEKFLTTAQTQDQEIDEVRSELRRYKTELKTSKAQNEELRRTLEIMEGQIRARDRERGDVIDREKPADTRVETLQTSVVELESRLSATLKEVGRLRSEKMELEERMEVLQKRSSEQEQREFEAIAHVRDSVQMVENAILERDQALVREQQKTQEVNRLQEVINKIVREAGKRTREEVDSVRNQCNKNIQKLMEEMHFLEMEGAEKQAQLERSLREKSAVEKELEKLYQEGPSEIARTGMTFEDLQKRISHAERTRDEALLKADNLSSTLKRIETKHDQEKFQGASENGELKRRIKQLESENEEISDNRLQLIDEIDKLKREVLTAKQGRETAEHQCVTEVASLKQQHGVREREFESRLRSVEQMNRQSVNELREMLNAQQKIGAQWKEESKALTQRFEQTVNELRREISAQKRRNDELNAQINEERQKREQLESKLSASKLSQEKLQSIVVDAETRADAASTQVTTLLNRERQLLQERKLINRELEKLKLEKSRPGSNRIREHPQRLSDLLGTTNAGAALREAPVRLDLMSPRGEDLMARELDGVGPRGLVNGFARDRVIL